MTVEANTKSTRKPWALKSPAKDEAPPKTAVQAIRERTRQERAAEAAAVHVVVAQPTAQAATVPSRWGPLLTGAPDYAAFVDAMDLYKRTEEFLQSATRGSYADVLRLAADYLEALPCSASQLREIVQDMVRFIETEQDDAYRLRLRGLRGQLEPFGSLHDSLGALARACKAPDPHAIQPTPGQPLGTGASLRDR